MIEGFSDVGAVSDADSIPDGKVWAISGTPGYVALSAIIVAGDAELVADAFVPDRRRLILARVGRSVERNPKKLAVTISERYFEEAHKEYRTDWRIVWWREAIQNAVDAKARNIRLEAREQDGFMVVSCDDDGIGMDLETIENKFLALGATTKGTSEDIGGFGVAKKILCFKWPKWELYSRNNFLLGQNGNAEQVEQEYRKGTLLRVWMPLEADEFVRAGHAETFLSRCHLRGVNITINGEPWSGQWLYNGRHVEDLEGEKVDAKIYYTKESQRLQGQCYVRTQDGLYMHSMDISSKIAGYVVIELVPKNNPDTGKPYPSIEYLSLNRDSLRDSLRYSISSFLRRIAAEHESALVGKTRAKAEMFVGIGKFQAELSEKQATLVYNMEVESKGDEFGLSKNSVRRVTDAMADAEGINADLLAALLKAKYTGQVHVETALKQIAGTYWKRDFYIFPDPTVPDFRTPKMFYPDTQTPTVHKLARVWADFCLYVMVALNCDRPFGVGWVFSTQFGACHLRENGQDWLLLNPYLTFKKALKDMGLEFNKEKLSENPLLDPSDSEHLRYMFSLAIHEATHMVDGVDEHDVDFAAAFTYNAALAGGGFKIIEKIAKSSRAIARAERETPSQEEERLAAAAITSVTGAVFDVQKIHEKFKELFANLGKMKFFVAGTVEGSLFYPEFDKQVMFQSSIESALARGLPLFAASDPNQDISLLIPSRRIPIIALDYASSGTVGWKRGVIDLAKHWPALAMSVLSGGSILDAWANHAIGVTDGYLVNEFDTYDNLRTTALRLADKLMSEYGDFVASTVFSKSNPSSCMLMYRLLLRYGSDIWSTQEGFKEVLTKDALRDYPIQGDRFEDETGDVNGFLLRRGLPERGWGTYESSSFAIPHAASELPVAPNLVQGRNQFVKLENKLILITPALSHYPFPHSLITEALATTVGSYASLVLIAQGRLTNVLWCELQKDRMYALKDGDDWESKRTFDPWLKQASEELDYASRQDEYFKRFGTSAEEVVSIIQGIVAHAKGWMDDQK